MENAINWFEIPALDMDRASAFYGAIFNKQLRREVFGGMTLAIFPTDEAAVSGALAQSDMHKPSDTGVLLYLNAGKEIDAILSRISNAGGTVIMPKTSIGEQGFMAILKDTEGNHVGLHQSL